MSPRRSPRRSFGWADRRRRARAGESGAIAPAIAIIAMVLLLLAGLGIDGSRQLNARAEAVAFAEEAARAGAQEIVPYSAELKLDESAARAAVARYCDTAAKLPQVTECRLVRFEYQNKDDARKIVVRTEVKTKIDTTLLGMIGVKNLSAETQATARPFEGVTDSIT